MDQPQLPPIHGGGDFHNPVLIPGTTSAWLPASKTNTAGSVQQPTIYHITL